jgi:hypothetical protein
VCAPTRPKQVMLYDAQPAISTIDALVDALHTYVSVHAYTASTTHVAFSLGAHCTHTVHGDSVLLTHSARGTSATDTASPGCVVCG